MREHLKIYTGNSIAINRLSYLLDRERIPSMIKNHSESGRLAGFGTTGDSVELHIFNSDLEKAKQVLDTFKSENGI